MLTQDELSTIEQNPYKEDFPLLEGNPDLAFLDSAATAQRPGAVLDAQRRFYETMNANPLRGLYRLSVEATVAIAQTRDKVAAFLGAVDEGGKPCGNQVVFTRNASGALNLVRARWDAPCSSRATRWSSPSWSTTPTSSRGSRSAARQAPTWSTCAWTRTTASRPRRSPKVGRAPRSSR